MLIKYTISSIFILLRRLSVDFLGLAVIQEKTTEMFLIMEVKT